MSQKHLISPTAKFKREKGKKEQIARAIWISTKNWGSGYENKTKDGIQKLPLNLLFSSIF